MTLMTWSIPLALDLNTLEECYTGDKTLIISEVFKASDIIFTSLWQLGLKLEIGKVSERFSRVSMRVYFFYLLSIVIFLEHWPRGKLQLLSMT